MYQEMCQLTALETSSSSHHRQAGAAAPQEQEEETDKTMASPSADILDSPSNASIVTATTTTSTISPVTSTSSSTSTSTSTPLIPSLTTTITPLTTTTLTTLTTPTAANLKANVFVRSESYVWLPARLLDSNEHEARVLVTVEASRVKAMERTVQLKDYPDHCLPLQNLHVYGDLLDLPFLHEPAILYNVKRRHLQSLPYTRAGDVLIAVNPYQWFTEQLYSVSVQKRYLPQSPLPRQLGVAATVSGVESALLSSSASSSSSSSLEPHVYQISALAYRGLLLPQHSIGVDSSNNSHLVYKNQSILVSGESGAGKTETVKICLQHIAAIQGPAPFATISSTSSLPENHSVEELVSAAAAVSSSSALSTMVVKKILDSNPLLEAFGNAKTVRNDNSSRFGKYLQLQFQVPSESSLSSNSNSNTYLNLVGSVCEVYLLEKSRVVSHAAGECTFHIFYQLLAASEEWKHRIWSDGLTGKSAESFRYLRGSNNNNNDSSSSSTEMHTPMALEQTIEALELVNIQDETLVELLRCICIVLQLGNLTFEPQQQPGDNDENEKNHERAVVANTNGALEALARLWGIMNDNDDSDSATTMLTRALTERTIAAGTELVTVPLTVAQAQDGCDALAKEVYARTFQWLVQRINGATAAPANATTAASSPFRTIGVLDIFGFEVFETNRFEQLCINYANEQLQNKFARDIFQTLLEEFQREEIDLGFSYETNADVLDLLSGRGGVLSILNEECIRPQGNDQAFVRKLVGTDKQKRPARLFHKSTFHPYEFGIHHFAGPVTYNAQDFVDTNRDTIPGDLLRMAQQSKNAVMAECFPSDQNTSSSTPSRRGSMVANTVVSKFRTQLHSLMHNLSHTQTRYIRCINPNAERKPLVLDNAMTMRQLRSGGVIAAIKVTHTSFPNRMDHPAMLKRFGCLAANLQSSSYGGAAMMMMMNNPHAAAKALKVQVMCLLAIALREYVSPTGESARDAAVVGKTRTYFRAGALEYLEMQRNANLDYFAVIIQRWYRGAPYRRRFVQQRASATQIAAVVRGFLVRQHVRRLPRAALRIQCWYRCLQAQRVLERKRQEFRARRIQQRWRGGLAAFRKRRHNKAAVSIQKMVRRFIQRARYYRLLQEKRLQEFHQSSAAGLDLAAQLEVTRRELGTKLLLEMKKKHAENSLRNRLNSMRLQLDKREREREEWMAHENKVRKNVEQLQQELDQARRSQEQKLERMKENMRKEIEKESMRKFEAEKRKMEEEKRKMEQEIEALRNINRQLIETVEAAKREGHGIERATSSGASEDWESSDSNSKDTTTISRPHVISLNMSGERQNSELSLNASDHRPKEPAEFVLNFGGDSNESKTPDGGKPVASRHRKRSSFDSEMSGVGFVVTPPPFAARKNEALRRRRCLALSKAPDVVIDPHKFEQLRSSYQALKDRNRRLAETNDCVQEVLFELNEHVSRLTQTNHKLAETVNLYQGMVKQLVSKQTTVSQSNNSDEDEEIRSEISDSFFSSLSQSNNKQMSKDDKSTITIKVAFEDISESTIPIKNTLYRTSPQSIAWNPAS